MKVVKVPVVVVVVIAVAIVALVVYLIHQNSKMAEDITANDRMKLENERLNLLTQFNTSKQLTSLEMREPVGFKLT